MLNPVVIVDRRLDGLLQERPEEAIRLIVQEYQITSDRPAFVAALAAKLVTAIARGRQ
jgi:hypothetical protein